MSDRLGRRKSSSWPAASSCSRDSPDPVRPADLFPPTSSGSSPGGLRRSDAAYTVIKEANPPEASGTATGVVNFLNFTFSALLGPVFGSILVNVSGGADAMTLEHYQTTFAPLLFGEYWRSSSLCY